MALSVWPGLAQIWSGQEVLGLLLALVFASALNLAIVSRWIWNEAFAPGWSDFLAMLAVVSWFASFGYTVWWVGLCHPDRHRQEIERLFREAQEAYLQGRWTDSKSRIERILAWDETDADALMQLGSLLSADATAVAGSPCVPAVLRIERWGEVALGDPDGPGPAGCKVKLCFIKRQTSSSGQRRGRWRSEPGLFSLEHDGFALRELSEWMTWLVVMAAGRAAQLA